MIPADRNRLPALHRAASELLAHAPGVVLGLSREGSRAVAAAGTLSHSDRTPVTAATSFDLASVTKVAATTAALLALVSAGELDLDTPVRRLVPGFSGGPDSSVRDLLGHRAGLWEWQPLYLAPGFAGGDSARTAAIVDAIPLRTRPGAGRHYSDLGFHYLGRVIEACSGTDLRSAVSALVIDPLGLSHTGFRAGPEGDPGAETSATAIASGSLGDRAEREMVRSGVPYPVLWPEAADRALQPGGFDWRAHELRGEANDGNCFHAHAGVAGHAGLFSSVPDLLTLAEALTGTGPGVPWSEATVREFFAPGPDPEQALGFRVGSLDVAGRPHRMLWHPGYTGCALGVVPELGLGLALASNRLLDGAPVAAASASGAVTPQCPPLGPVRTPAPTPTAQLWQCLLESAGHRPPSQPTSSRNP